MQFEPRPVVSLQRYPLVHRKKGPLQDGTEVLRSSLLMAGYKYEADTNIEGLPTVGVIAEPRTLPFQTGFVVGWHPSSHHKEVRKSGILTVGTSGLTCGGKRCWPTMIVFAGSPLWIPVQALVNDNASDNRLQWLHPEHD